MIVEEGLEYVQEVRLPQDPQSFYTGYLDQNSKRKGQGTKVYKNGDKYSGEWDDDQSNGKGQFWHQDGDYFFGDWVDGKAHGKGVYTQAN